jgi:hypothetical protein
MTRLPLLQLLLPVVLAGRLAAQAPGACWDPMPASPADSLRTAAARLPRTVQAISLSGTPPVIDGKLDEPAWCSAPPAMDFVQSRPAPGALATLPSRARILFDQSAVYVAVRLFDPHPDSLSAPYPRRDDEVTSDWVFVELDTRFDRRSGFSFGLNPRGVQVDGSWWDDVNYDAAWNGVWQGAASVDGDGWTAEFRIPFSQLALQRGTAGASLTWGINLYRTTPHRGETSNWSPRLPTVTGIVSRFNRLEGLVAPSHGTGIELVPYGAVTGVHAPAGGKDRMSNRLGGDIRIRPTPASSVLLSLHPDFGQVEADPSQVNLTTFETFLPEQRPLFVEGADVFQFNGGLNFSSRATSFADETPFYSRRIGRPPQASLPEGISPVEVASSTTILGAGRLSLRTPSGWSGGAFQAWTNSERGHIADSLGRREVQLDPVTSFSVLRATHESSGGQSAIGVMLTGVNRIDQSARIDSQLPGAAFLAGSDARWRGRSYELTGFLLGSRVSGSRSAIAALRAEPRHGYDQDEAEAPAARTLNGVAAQARLARTEGSLLWGVSARMVSQGFEANDLGFQRNADWLLLAGDWQYQAFRPGHWLRRWAVGSSNAGVGWTTAGELRAATGNLVLSGDLRSYWGGSLSYRHEFSASDPEVLRGGPSLLLPARDRAVLQLYSDTRRRWQFTWTATGEQERGSDSRRWSLGSSLSAFVTDRLQLGLSPSVAWIREGWQYVAQPRDQAGKPRYIMGRLEQREASLTTRATYAFSPHLTLQWYAQGFVSNGRYRGFLEVGRPKAAHTADRVAGIVPGRLGRDTSGAYTLDFGSDSSVTFADPAFAERILNLNLVLRWEFLPGSALFLVWTEERRDPGGGHFSLGRDLRRLLHGAATDALQLKVSYWISP